MISSGIYVKATLNVTFSFMVRAKRKSQALEIAQFRMNEKNIILDRIQLVNDQGIKNWVKVDQLGSIHWMTVESSEYTHLFTVVGQIRLALSIDLRTEHLEESLWKTAYHLPRSRLLDRSILVIPTSSEPAFTQVLSQSLELNVESKQTISSIRVG
jgi:hypothetical protein